MHTSKSHQWVKVTKAIMYFCFISAKSADPYEMLSDATFHLILHFLPNYLFTGLQNKMLADYFCPFNSQTPCLKENSKV